VALYKPQEMIRLEVEQEQMKSEHTHMQELNGELVKKVNHLSECIKDCNSKIFLKE